MVHVLGLVTGSDVWTFEQSESVNALAFSDNGSTLAVGTYDNATIYLYDVASQQEIGRLPDNKRNAITALVFWRTARPWLQPAPTRSSVSLPSRLVFEIDIDFIDIS